MKICNQCSTSKPLTEFYLRKDRNCHIAECITCFKARMGNRHQQHKDILVAENGNKCCRCGYDRNSRVLQFHHLDPNEKDFGISQSLSGNLEKLRKEVEKCILLCPNCHAEKHLNMW